MWHERPVLRFEPRVERGCVTLRGEVMEQTPGIADGGEHDTRPCGPRERIEAAAGDAAWFGIHRLVEFPCHEIERDVVDGTQESECDVPGLRSGSLSRQPSPPTRGIEGTSECMALVGREVDREERMGRHDVWMASLTCWSAAVAA